MSESETKKDEVLPGLEPGSWEDVIRIPSDNRYTTGPYALGWNHNIS